MNVRSIKYLLKFITYNYEYLKVKKINFSELEALDIKLDYTSKQTLKTTVNKYLKQLNALENIGINKFQTIKNDVFSDVLKQSSKDNEIIANWLFKNYSDKVKEDIHYSETYHKEPSNNIDILSKSIRYHLNNPSFVITTESLDGMVINLKAVINNLNFDSNLLPSIEDFKTINLEVSDEIKNEFYLEKLNLLKKKANSLEDFKNIYKFVLKTNIEQIPTSFDVNDLLDDDVKKGMALTLRRTNGSKMS